MGSYEERRAKRTTNTNVSNTTAVVQPQSSSVGEYESRRAGRSNSVLIQPKAVPRTSAEVKLEMARVQRKRDEASKKRQNYSGKGAWLINANPEASAAMHKLSSADADAEFMRWDNEYNRLREELYSLENENKLSKLGTDENARNAYAAGQSAREDKRTLYESLLPTSIPGADLPVGFVDSVGQQRQQNMAELQQKYGARDIFSLGARIGANEKQAASELEEHGYNFDRMTDYQQRQLDAAEREAEREQNLRFADEHGVLSSLSTIGAAPAQGLDYISIAAQTMMNDFRGKNDWRPVNTDKLHVTNYVTDIRGRVGDNIEENTKWEIGGQNVVRFLYDTAMSMGDSAATIMLAGPAASVLLGGSAASQTAINVLQNGGTAGQATMSGFAAGTAELIFERYSIENLLQPRNVTSMKRLVTETLKQSGVEGSEEMATEVANILSNALIMGQNSDFNKAVEAYTAQGMTEQEAKKQAIMDCIGQIAWAGVGGALSGGAMGGGMNTMNLAGNAAFAQQMYGNNPEALISQTLAVDGGNKLAKKLQDRVHNKQDISGLQLSTLNEQRLTAFEKQENEKKKSGNTEQTIEQRSQKYHENAKVMKDNYIEGQNLEEYDKAFRAMLDMGYLGVNKEVAMDDERVHALTKEQREAAYQAGRQRKGAVEVADTVSEYDVSEEGKTVHKGTDKVVELGEVVSVDGGTMTFRLADGSEAVSTDLSYGTEDEAALYYGINYAANTPAQANLMISGFKDSGMSGEAFSKGIRHAYNYGRHQLPMGQMMKINEVKALPAEVRRTAYEAGKTLREHRTQQKQAALDNSRQGRKADKAGRVLRLNGSQEIQSLRDHLQKDGTQLTEVQEASIFGMERLTALMGVDMYVFESYVNNEGDRVYIDEHGREVLAPNGYYENGRIYIDMNAGQIGEGTMLYTVSHELTHFIQEWSPAKYDVLCEVIMDGYARAGISVDQLVREQIIKAAENGRTISYEEAFDEVVADSMESMLADGRVIEMMAELKQRDKSLWEKICDFFTELLEDLKAMVNAYKHHKPNSKEGRMVADMQEVIDKIQPIFAEALLDAGAANRTATKNTAENSGVKYQARPFAEQVDEVRRNTYGHINHVYMGTTPTRLSKILGLPKAPMLITPNHVYSIAVSTQQAKKEKRYKKNVHYHNLGWGAVKQLPRMLNEPVLIIKSTLDVNDSRFVVVTNQVDYAGNPIFIAVKPNGRGYFYNIDFISNISLSAYGKNSVQNYVDTAKKENRILYAYKKSSQNKNIPGVQFPNNILNSDYSKNLSDFQTIVKAEFKNTIFENSGLPKYSFRRATAIDGVAQAEQMERDGRSRSDIWYELGIIRDAAGNWVAEIDDSNAEFYAAGDARLQNNPDWMRYKELEGKMINRTITDEEHRELKELAVVVRVLRRGSTLQDYLKHDELYRAAPYLKDIPFRMEIMNRDRRGQRSEDGITVNSGLDADEKISTTLHEAQHAIQDAEGRPSGASVTYWLARKALNGEIIRKNERKIAKAEQDKIEAWEKMPERVKNKVREINRELIAAKESGDFNHVSQLEDEMFDSEYADLYAKYSNALWSMQMYAENNEPLSPENLYYLTAGEIESRLVQQRRNMTAKQRRARMPDFQWDDAVFAETKNTTGNGGVRYQARSAKESPEVVSIKEQIAANQNNLNSMDAVADVRVPDLRNWNTKQRRKWAEDELRKTGYQIDRQGFGQINFNPSQINKALNYLNDAGEIAGFAALPRVLKRGQVIFDNGNHKGRNFRTVTFAAPVKINGVRGNMAAVVQQTKGYNYHMHRVLMPDGSSFVFENKKDTEGTPAGALSQRDTHAEPIASVSDTSIYDFGQNSNKKLSDRSRKTAATLERENKRLKQDVKYLRELVRLQKKVTDGSKVKRRDVETMAKLLMRNNNVKGDYRELAPMLTDLYEFMAVQEEPDMEVIREKAQPAVDWLLDHVQESKKLDPYAEEILGVLKSSSVRFNDTQKAEAASLMDGWGKYRNNIIGAVGVSDKATQTLDQLWADLAQSYPKTFDASISDAQQPAALLDAIEELRSMKEDNFGFDPALLEQVLLQEVYDGYWRVSTLQTVADVYQKRIDELKRIHFEEMEQSREALVQQMDMQEAAYQRYMDETIAQERAQVQQQKEEYTADRRKAVDKRKKTARKKSIQKTARKLDTLLNRGTKEKNIKEELQPMVERALTAANTIMQTDNEMDYIRFGVAVDLTTREQKAYDEARELLAEIDAYWEIHDAYDAYDEMKRAINGLERRLSELKDLHGREVAARKKLGMEVTDEFSVTDLLKEPLHCFISNREAQLIESANEMMQQIYSMQPKEVAAYNHIKKLESKLNYRMKKLTEVFERERVRRDKMTVSTVLNDLATAYQALEGATGYLSGAYDAVVYDYLRGLNENIGSTNVKDMSLWQLEKIDEAFTMVLTTVNNVNEAFTDERKRGITEMGETAMSEFGTQKQIKPLEIKGMDVLRKLHWNNLKPVYAFERLGSAVLKERFDAVRKGEDVYARDVTEARQFYLEKAKKFGAFEWNLEERIEFADADGKHFKLNRDQMMSIYAYSRRKQAHEHLLQGGIVFDENTEIKGEKIYGVPVTLKPTTANTYRIDSDVLQMIGQTLTEEQRLFAQEMQDYLSEDMAAKGNEVSMKMYGVKLFKEKHYFPLHSAKQFNRKAAEQQEAGEHSPRRLKNNGMTKAVTPEANNPIVLSGFMDTWSGHVDEMSMYHAFVLPLEDFNRVFKYMTQDPKSGAKSVDAAMQNAHGSAATQYVTQLINDLNGGARSDSRETPMKNLVAKWKKAAVFTSMSVVVQQPSSIGRAFAEISPTYFRPSDFATFGEDHTAAWEEVKKYAPVAIIKEMGYFDTNMGQSTTEFLQKRVYEGGREKALAMLKDSQYRDDVLSILPAYADEMTWCTIWGAVKREQAMKHTDLKTGSDEFLQLCGERFTEIIGKTQVYDSVLARSGNMRSKSLYMNMATAFLAEPTTSINMVEDAVYKMIRGGDKKAGAKQIGAVVASVVLNSFLSSLVYAARDDDEDETFTEKYVSRLVEETIDGLNPLTYYPIVKDVFSICQGYDVERADMSLVADVVDSINNLRRLSEKDTSAMDEAQLDEHMKQIWEARLEFVDYATAFGGISFKNMRRDFNAIFNLSKTLYKDATERDTTLLSLADAVLPVIGVMDEKKAADKLYAATVKGDAAYVKRLNAAFATDSSRKTAIRRGLRENDPRIKEAAILYINGNYEEYRAVYNKILNEKHFSQNDIVKAIQSEINALTPDEATSDTVEKIQGLFNEDNYVQSLLDGKSGTAETIRQDVINTYVANGSTQDEAVKSFISKTKSAIKERYLEGDMTEEEAFALYTEYAEMDETTARNKVRAYSWMRKHPEFDFTESQALNYTAPIDGLGVSPEDCGIAPNTFADYLNDVSTCKGVDSDGDGKADRNSKKNQILAVIDAMPISNSQKDALYILNGWAKSNLRKAPWH